MALAAFCCDMPLALRVVLSSSLSMISASMSWTIKGGTARGEGEFPTCEKLHKSLRYEGMARELREGREGAAGTLRGDGEGRGKSVLFAGNSGRESNSAERWRNSRPQPR